MSNLNSQECSTSLDPSTPTVPDMAAPPSRPAPPPVYSNHAPNFAATSMLERPPTPPPPTPQLPDIFDETPPAAGNLSMSRLLTLPPELLLEIGEHLPVEALFRLSLCCNHLHNLLLSLRTAAFSEHSNYALSWSIQYDDLHLFTRALAHGVPFSPIDMTRIIRWRRAALIPALFAVYPNYCRDLPRGMRHPPLHQAAIWNSVECLVALLGAGDPPDLRDLPGATALHKAAENKAEECVEALLRAGAQPDMLDERGFTPLHYAAVHSSEGSVSALLRAGALPDRLNEVGEAALHYAASHGEGICVGALLRAGALPTLPNMDGYPPLHYALSSGYEGVVRDLIAAGAGRMIEIRQMVEGETEVIAQPSDRGGVPYAVRCTPEMMEGEMEVIVQPSDRDGMLFAVRCTPQMVAVLAEAGWVGPSAKGEMTPLRLAVATGREETVRVLLEAGADVDELGYWHDTVGWAPLHECVFQEGGEEMMDLLVEKGARLDVLGGVCAGADSGSVPGGGKGLTPLQLAQEINNHAAVAKLETYGTRG